MKTLGLLFLAGILMSCSERDEKQTVTRPKTVQTVSVDLDTFLADKLVTAENGSFQKISKFSPPTKYYVFYETASWCAPCKRFSPTLYSFYNLFHEMYPDQFEIIVFSYDKSEEAMLKYASKSKVKFPHISYTGRDAFKENVPILTAALPNLTVVDTEGNVLKSGFSKTGRYMGPLVPMNFLKEKLQESNRN